MIASNQRGDVKLPCCGIACAHYDEGSDTRQRVSARALRRHAAGIPRTNGDESDSHLITAYAFGVVVGAPLHTALCARLLRKTVLLAMMTLFVVGNVLFALSPSLELGLVFRFIAGLPHGAFFGAGAIVAAGPATGWYVELAASGVRVGVGFYDASPAGLSAIRTAIDGPDGAAVEKIVGKLTRAGRTGGRVGRSSNGWRRTSQEPDGPGASDQAVAPPSTIRVATLAPPVEAVTDHTVNRS